MGKKLSTCIHSTAYKPDFLKNTSLHKIYWYSLPKAKWSPSQNVNAALAHFHSTHRRLTVLSSYFILFLFKSFARQHKHSSAVTQSVNKNTDIDHKRNMSIRLFFTSPLLVIIADDANKIWCRSWSAFLFLFSISHLSLFLVRNLHHYHCC